MISDVSLPITEIGEYFNNDYLKRVLLRVKKYYSGAPAEVKSSLHILDSFLSFNREERRAINKAFKGVVASWIKESGSSKIRVFPEALLISFRQSTEIAKAVLEAWVDSCPELDSAVREALAATDIPIEESYGSGKWIHRKFFDRNG